MTVVFYPGIDQLSDENLRLRVPKYGAYLEFLNFALLLFTFVLCLFSECVFHIGKNRFTRVADQYKERLTPWEVAFMVLGCAFTLEEYTAANEHGWISWLSPQLPVSSVLMCVFLQSTLPMSVLV